MHSSSQRSSNDSRRRRSRTDSRLSVTEATFQHLSLASQSPSPTRPTVPESHSSSQFINSQYTPTEYISSSEDSRLGNPPGIDPNFDPNQPNWHLYPSQPSTGPQVPVIQFGLEPSIAHAHPQLEYCGHSSQPETYSSATMRFISSFVSLISSTDKNLSSLDYVTMLPSGPFVPQGFYHPSQYSSMTGDFAYVF
jgi:hypothetical protein